MIDQSPIKESLPLESKQNVKMAILSEYFERQAGLVLDGHKLFWHRNRVEAWLCGERIAPITIDCALTRNCSYRCA